MHISRRQIWLLLGVETAFLIALAVWVLWRFDQLFEPLGIIVALGIVVAGDLVSALLLQRNAPTRITLEPGEASQSPAKVVSGFGDSPTGEVLVKGERWRARREGSGRLSSGDRVDVVARTGLTLYVKAIDSNGGGASTA